MGVAPDLGTLRPLTEDALPKEWGGWRRVKFEAVERSGGNREMLGRFSRTWWFARGPLWAAVSVDGPFWKWHDLAWCYEGQGWNCEDVTDVRYADAFDGDIAAPADRSGGYTEMHLEDDAGNSGIVLFAGYDDGHAGVDPLAQRLRLSERLGNLRRVWDRLTGREPDAAESVGRTYQIQLLHTNLVAPDEAAETELRKLFHEMRRRLVAREAAVADSEAAVADPTDATAAPLKQVGNDVRP